MGLIVSTLTLPAKPVGFSLIGNVRSVRIPVEIQNNIVLIPIQINGSFEMNFILDTGVRTTILTEPVIASFLSLDSLSTVKVRGLGEGEAIDAALARNVAITLPGVEGRGINLLVLPEGLISYSGMFGKPVYGIIGYELFGQFIVEINYHQKYIELFDPFQYQVRGKWSELPIVIRRSKPYVEATMTDYRGVEITAYWLVDTGASMALSLFDKSLPLPETTIHAFLGQGLSGFVYGKLGRSRQFVLGDFVFEQVITGYPDPDALNLMAEDSSWYGNMGAEIISRFRVILDYNAGKMYLRKNPRFKDLFEYNTSGLELIGTGTDYNTFIISYVRPNSPAEKAGVLPDDELLSINGMATDGLSLDQIYNMLDRQSGKRLNLRLRRGGQVEKLSFDLVREI
ncbi:MAG: aspartyl protease family protein [Bacteroidia bacterium]|nr:aspartyl protease family protein [Bacteroidia bacterium]